MNLIYPKFTSIRKIPKNLKEEDYTLFDNNLVAEINESNLIQLKSVYILKDTIFDLKRFRFFFSYTHFHIQKLTIPQIINKKFGRIIKFFTKGKKIKKAIWITDNWSPAYFHWFTEAISRLIVCEEFHKDYIVVLPKTFEKYNYATESLKILNCKYQILEKRSYFVEKLVLPSHTATIGNYNENIINLIRDKFLINFPNIPHRKIYISRAKAEKRKIINEDEVIELLNQYDYEIHTFEDYPLIKQIEIMSQTKSLISLHGAGLTNMIFMPANGQIMEFRNKDDNYNNCFFSLASALNHSYFYQQNLGDTKDTHIVNLTIDLTQLKENLDFMS